MVNESAMPAAVSLAFEFRRVRMFEFMAPAAAALIKLQPPIPHLNHRNERSAFLRPLRRQHANENGQRPNFASSQGWHNLFRSQKIICEKMHSRKSTMRFGRGGTYLTGMAPRRGRGYSNLKPPYAATGDHFKGLAGRLKAAAQPRDGQIPQTARAIVHAARLR
jgi:hypothetical protein